MDNGASKCWPQNRTSSRQNECEFLGLSRSVDSIFTIFAIYYCGHVLLLSGYDYLLLFISIYLFILFSTKEFITFVGVDLSGQSSHHPFSSKPLIFLAYVQTNFKLTLSLPSYKCSLSISGRPNERKHPSNIRGQVDGRSRRVPGDAVRAAEAVAAAPRPRGTRALWAAQGLWYPD